VGTVKDEQHDPRWDAIIELMRRQFNGVLILAGGYTLESARYAIESGRADVIAFGRPFIANPDLPARFRDALPLNEADPSTFFGGSAKGYIDYPAFAAALG
jgi:N-ethylmaleimide reductase